jgi:predicted NBD/HSP70 family sugar kinase
MLQKADIDLVRRQNRGLVLETLRHHGPLSRIELGRMTGLSPATITSIAGQLIDEGFVLSADEDTRSGAARRGRPQTRLDLAPGAANVLAVSVSVDGIDLALADFRGQVRATQRQTPDMRNMTADGLSKLMVTEIRTFLVANRIAQASVARIGVAVQGVADTLSGAIAWSPAFPARNVPVVAPLTSAFGIPCVIGNNANMIAEALIDRDRLRYGGTTAVIYMGHGVGLGLILDGHVYSGTSGRAAEFGHMNHEVDGALCRCGRRGCVEAYCADYAIVRMATAGTENFDVHAPVPAAAMQRLAQEARAGDGPGRRAFETAGQVLGYGVARLIALINPERVVLAGPGTVAVDLMKRSFDAAIERAIVHDLRKDVEFEVADVNTDMIIRGTIVEALRHLDRDVFASGPLAAPAVSESKRVSA